MYYRARYFPRDICSQGEHLLGTSQNEMMAIWSAVAAAEEIAKAGSMVRVVALRKGTETEDFATWLTTSNFTALRSIKRLDKFAVFRVEKRVMTQEQASADYIDLFEIPDISGFIAEDPSW